MHYHMKLYPMAMDKPMLDHPLATTHPDHHSDPSNKEEMEHPAPIRSPAGPTIYHKPIEPESILHSGDQSLHSIHSVSHL